MRPILAAIILLSMMAGGEAAPTIDCKSIAGSGRGWVWRNVDGKRCWYQGSRRIDKKRLAWRPATPSTPVLVPPQRNIRVLDVKRVEELPVILDFNSRWWGERK